MAFRGIGIMEKNIYTADGKSIVDQDVIDLKNLWDRRESSEIYDADETGGTRYPIESFRERRPGTMDLVKQGKFNGVLEKPHQLEEILCNPASWLDIFLTVAAGLLIVIILFGAFLH